MSRFLKLIVSLALIVFILAGIGLIVPQFLGVDVVVVQETNAGNQKVGTAIYTQKKDVAVLAPGEKILDLGTTSLNVFTVTGYDPSTGVVDVTGGNLDSLLVSRTWLKVLAAVPFIGFLSIATQSTGGLIFLGVLLGVVILLFIFSEILRKNDDDDYADEDDDFYTDLVEKRRSADLDDEDEDTGKKKDRKRRRRGGKSRKKEEEDEQEDLSAPDITKVIPENEPDIRERFREEPDEEPERDPESGMEEIPEAEADEEEASAEEEPEVEMIPGYGRDFGTDSLPDVQAALEAALENQPLNRSEDTHVPETQDVEPEMDDMDADTEIELAIPVKTAEEILQDAYASGYDPKVQKDRITGISLMDFSDSL